MSSSRERLRFPVKETLRSPVDWRLATWLVPVVFQIALGIFIVLTWLLVTWFSALGSMQAVFLVSTALTTIISAAIALVLIKSDTFRSRSIGMSVAGSAAATRWWSRVHGRHQLLVAQLMSGESVTNRYGPLGLVAAVLTIVVLEVPIWMLAPAPIGILFLVGPLLIAVLAVAFMLTLCGGTAAQIGRGMLIGSIAALLSLAVFGGAIYVAQVVGII